MEQPKHRILVVDDNRRNVAILQEILSPYQLATADSGEEALRIAVKFAPDLVLLDIMMPGMDGYETCRRFRANPQIAETKIIMVSAKAMVSERLAGYEAGADDYVIKPFNEDELTAKVRVYLRLKSVEELNRLKTDILTLISHETRTPLTTIFGPLELLMGELNLSPQCKLWLRMIEDGARRIESLLDKANHLSSLQAGLIDFEFSRHDLGRIVREAITEIRPAATTAGVELTLLHGGPFDVNCDVEQIHTSVAALLNNAVRHSPSPGKVEIAITMRDSCASVSVVDHGQGIPEQFLPHVFDCFSVPDVNKHTSGKGHGLSLATAMAVVRGHGGALSAENRLGGGAAFEIRLPLAGERS